MSKTGCDAGICQYFGWLSMMSLFVNIKTSKRGWTLIGEGLGHGVGYCVYGGNELGEMGYFYKDILSFYFN